VVSFLDQKPSTLAGTEATVNFQRALGQPRADEAWSTSELRSLSPVFGDFSKSEAAAIPVVTFRRVRLWVR
jgi:hypothetical protein